MSVTAYRFGAFSARPHEPHVLPVTGRADARELAMRNAVLCRRHRDWRGYWHWRREGWRQVRRAQLAAPRATAGLATALVLIPI